jgi:hypothetical protein
MKIQRWHWLGLIGILVLTCQVRALAEEGAPSNATLSEMGLSGLSMMSDDDAMDIRGEGFKGGGSSASAWGSSWANVSTPFGSAGSKNGYSAHGKHSASGDNLSFAGAAISVTTSKNHGKGGDKGGNWSPKTSSKGNGGWGGMGGGDKGGKGGMGGSKTTVVFVVFAGGSSHAHAH